jgi:DNA end-binding protein Ku
VLILDQMRFANEIRSPEGLKLPSKDQVGKKEIEMAIKLIAQLTEKFDIKAYHDTYTEQLQQVINAKIEGKELPKASRAPKPSKIHDIMPLLKASLDEPHDKGSKKEKKHKTGTKG